MFIRWLLLDVDELLEKAEQVKLWMPNTIHLDVLNKYTHQEHGSITPLKYVLWILADVAEVSEVYRLSLPFFQRLLLFNFGWLKQVLNDEQDGRNCLIAEDLNKRRH